MKNDEQLMMDLKSGDQDALTTLYGRWSRDLLRFIRSRVHDQDGADDVLQKVFMRVHRSAATFEEGRSVKPWLYSMTDRLCKNANRDNHRRVNRLRPVSDDQPTVERPDEPSDNVAALPQLVMELPDDLRHIAQFVGTSKASLRKSQKTLGVGRLTLAKQLAAAREVLNERLRGPAITPVATIEDLQLRVVGDLLDLRAVADQEALGRVVLGNNGDDQDAAVFKSFLAGMLGC